MEGSRMKRGFKLKRITILEKFAGIPGKPPGNPGEVTYVSQLSVANICWSIINELEERLSEFHLHLVDLITSILHPRSTCLSIDFTENLGKLAGIPGKAFGIPGEVPGVPYMSQCLSYMDPAEIEFLAEEEPISIIPKFNDMRTIHLISGDIGPFRAGIPVTVPLWVAISLRKKEKCTIVAPDWLDVEKLEAKLEEEKDSGLFTKMPCDHYMGIAHLIFSVASHDIENSDRLKLLIKDLWDLRISKARSSADSFLRSGEKHAGVDFLTQLEISTLRPLLLDALDTAQYLLAPRDNLPDMTPSLNNTSRSSTSRSQ